MKTVEYELCDKCEQAMADAGVIGSTLEEMIENEEEFDFGTAIMFLQEGYKLARKGWKEMWIVLMPELHLEASAVNERTSKHLGEGVDLDSQPYIAIFTEDKKWQPGWIPSHNDLLSNDWYITK